MPEEDGSVSPFLTIQGNSVYFQEDWRQGIGGGLWSTGLALARYFQTDHAAQQLKGLWKRRTLNVSKKGLDVLELGSGNGLLAIALVALGREFIENIFVTDMEDHLHLISKTIRANEHLVSERDHLLKIENVHVIEHVWGEFLSSRKQNASTPDHRFGEGLVEKVAVGKHEFDLIVGSDVAYREDLYDPLIASIIRFSSPQTVCLIGVTMADTKPEFFNLLDRAGLMYEKFADYLVPQEFRGSTFGIFVIQKKKPEGNSYS